ncbi:uncharacterized protein LOC144003786 isoform X2 [Festucalex cinctus]
MGEGALWDVRHQVQLEFLLEMVCSCVTSPGPEQNLLFKDGKLKGGLDKCRLVEVPKGTGPKQGLLTQVEVDLQANSLPASHPLTFLFSLKLKTKNVHKLHEKRLGGSRGVCAMIARQHG